MTHREGRGRHGPALFDAVVGLWLVPGPALRVPGWALEQTHAILFCGGTMGLWAISQWCRPQRLVRLPGLALLSVLALGSSIAHSRERLGGIIDQYFHLYRSEEHTSELQSQSNLVCRLLLEKKNI